MKIKDTAKQLAYDTVYSIVAGFIVGTAFHFFQNSNEFAPGGVGGLATITHHLAQNAIPWSVLMIAFNLPISIPLWQAVLGSVIAIVIVKQLYGGIGKNVVNPALAARVFLTGLYINFFIIR